jgi:four helix bundle protein
MTPEEMKKRIRDFALRCLRLVRSFAKGPIGSVVSYQLPKSCTSAAANYRAACIARSRADFVSKIGLVEEETDESVFWVDFAADAELTQRQRIEGLLAEGKEILAIIIASRKTARAGLSKEPKSRGRSDRPGA